jgi:pimeloyl-ACP methyl ester carboxylesterase
MYVHATVPVDLARLQQIRPDAIIGTVIGSGHFVMLAVPDQINAMLDRFLAIVASPQLAS